MDLPFHVHDVLWILCANECESVHDGDIVPVLSALRIFHDEGDLLPLTEIKHDRKWKTSKVTPMGGRIIFERLRCWVDIASGVSRPSEAFVRVNINDGVVSLPGCDIGSGLCSLEQFVAQLRKNQEDVGNFRSVCGLDDSLPERISFLHQRFVSHA
jgi:acid phosphatase